MAGTDIFNENESKFLIFFFFLILKLRYSLLSGALDENNDDADDDDDGDIDLYYNLKIYISPVEAWPCSFHISVLKKKYTHRYRWNIEYKRAELTNMKA